jgi:hypothetical protein
MQSFRINESLEVICETKNTRNGFKHEAILLKNGLELNRVKCTYLNRTWERYTYETVLTKLKSDTAKNGLISDKGLEDFGTAIDKGGEHDMRQLESVAMVAKMGEIFHMGDKKGINDWKTRMLKAGLDGFGLIMPKDWDSLSEDEKEARLNGAISQLK